MSWKEVDATQVIPIVTNDPDNRLAREFPFYPLNAPGMPPPGPSFTRLATSLARANAEGDQLVMGSYPWYVHWLYLRALYDPECRMLVDLAGKSTEVRLLLGHLWGSSQLTGPTRPDCSGPVVMVVGKNIGTEEIANNKNFCGPTSQFFQTVLQDIGLPPEVTSSWYVTNLVRWLNFDPKAGALPAKWIADCLPLLHQELRLIRPDYLLLLGAEATKAVLCNRRMKMPDGSWVNQSGETLKSMAGRSVELQIPLHESVAEEEQYHTIKVMAITHPAAVVRTTELLPSFRESLTAFKDLYECGEIRRRERPCEVRVIYTERELTDVVSMMLARPGLKKIAVDCEWEGEFPGEPGSYLRTIQFTDREDLAVVVVLRHQGGGEAFYPSAQAAFDQVSRLLDRDDVQYRGHYPASDIPWLEHNGVRIIHRLTVPPTVDGLNHGEYAGVFATDLAEHAVEETAEFKLELVCSRRLGVQRWDTALNSWKKTFCAERGLNDEDLEGYGEAPAEILIPYAAEDVVETWRLAEEYIKPGGLLDRDRFGHDCWVPFHQSLIAFPAFLEMHLQGMRVDRAQYEALVDQYEAVLADITASFRQEVGWPDFNPRSPMQCRALLFGEAYSGKKPNKDGQILPVLPDGVTSLNLQPVKSCGKRGKDWNKVRQEGQASAQTPSTDKEVLGILGADNPLAGKLRDIRFIEKALSGTLYPPTRNRKGELILDDQGRRTYEGGILSYVCCDGRVHGRFSQTMETGRANSWSPNLQNQSSKRESDYRRVCGERYTVPMRTMFTSDFDARVPTVIIGADYSGAELLVEAVSARDLKMIEHCQRASLPDGHPDQYDIHSNVAVQAFRLNCEPSKKGLKSIGKAHLRIAAKAVIFSSQYGGSAGSIARKCKEEGTQIEENEVQRLLDTLFTIYDRVPVFQDDCRKRVIDPCWIRNPFGRYRRVIPSDDRQVLGELERQMLNFVPQSTVADAVDRALQGFVNHPRRQALGYKVWLQLHDAIYLEVPAPSVDEVYHEVMPACMVSNVSFKSCNLDGMPYADSPDYRFSIDKHVYVRWGEGLTTDWCQRLGISGEYAHDGD